jgi:hypothetical protein
VLHLDYRHENFCRPIVKSVLAVSVNYQEFVASIQHYKW